VTKRLAGRDLQLNVKSELWWGHGGMVFPSLKGFVFVRNERCIINMEIFTLDLADLEPKTYGTESSTLQLDHQIPVNIN
jgi:hypothetical protein